MTKMYKLRIYLLYFISLTLIVMLNLFYSFDRIQSKAVTVFVICIFLLILVCLYYRDRKFTSFNLVFISLLFLFHLGHQVLFLIGENTALGFDMRVYTTESLYLKSIIYSINFIYFIFTGMILVKRNISIESKNKLSKKNVMKTVAYILLAMSIIPRLYMDSIKIVAFINGNYTSTRLIVFSGALEALGKLFFIALLLLMLYYRNNRRMQTIIYVIVLVYNLVYMSTGNRADSVIYILIFTLVFVESIRKIRFKQFLALISIAYLSIVMISFVSDFRFMTNRSMQELYKLFMFNAFSNNPVLSIFAELGVSIQTVFYSLEFFPSIKSHSLGLNYLESAFLIFPNIGGLVSDLIQKLTFIYYFPQHQVMGGSIIGEFYYAFGSFSILSILIGVFISKLQKYYQISKQNNDLLKELVALIIFSSILWWIRDYFYNTIRDIVWLSFIVYIVTSFVEKLSVKRGY